MTSETRYFTFETKTINGLLGCHLDTSNHDIGSGALYINGVPAGTTAEWGIRIFKRDSGGTETELTSGTPIAIVSRNADGFGLQTGTDTISTAGLGHNDSLIIRAYVHESGGAWFVIFGATGYFQDNFYSRLLIGSTLTVTYYTFYEYEVASVRINTSVRIGDDGLTYKVKIENFTYEEHNKGHCKRNNSCCHAAM